MSRFLEKVPDWSPTPKDRRVNTGETPRSKFMHDRLCIVCMEEFTPEQDVAALSCNGHKRACTLYHRQCLTQWLGNKAECPMCRDNQFIDTHRVAIAP